MKSAQLLPNPHPMCALCVMALWELGLCGAPCVMRYGVMDPVTPPALWRYGVMDLRWPLRYGVTEPGRDPL